MLSGRGIDGELKSKFGELTENFWKSSSWGNPGETKNVQAIYFTSKGGNDGVRKAGVAGGKAGEKEERKEKRDNANVVLVGGDEKFNSGLKEKIKGQGSWTSGNGSVVEGGRDYSRVFEQVQKNDRRAPNGGQFNHLVLNKYYRSSKEKDALLKNLCPGAETIKSGLQTKCEASNLSRNDVSNLKLPQFLNSDYAKSYFEDKVGEQYQGGGKYLALLALMNLGSTDLVNIYFPNSVKIFDHEQDNFKLNSLMTSAEKILYLRSEAQSNELDSISYHSGGMGTVQLCSSRSGCSNDNGLNLTMGNGKFCVIDKVCFSDKDSQGEIQRRKNDGERFSGSGTALGTKVFGSSNKINPYQSTLISLVVACFSDVKNVSLIIKTSPTKEKLVAKH